MSQGEGPRPTRAPVLYTQHCNQACGMDAYSEIMLAWTHKLLFSGRRTATALWQRGNGLLGTWTAAVKVVVWDGRG